MSNLLNERKVKEVMEYFGIETYRYFSGVVIVTMDNDEWIIDEKKGRIRMLHVHGVPGRGAKWSQSHEQRTYGRLVHAVDSLVQHNQGQYNYGSSQVKKAERIKHLLDQI